MKKAILGLLLATSFALCCCKDSNVHLYSNDNKYIVDDSLTVTILWEPPQERPILYGTFHGSAPWHVPPRVLCRQDFWNRRKSVTRLGRDCRRYLRHDKPRLDPGNPRLWRACRF